MRIMNAMLVVLFILVLCTGATGQSNTQRGIDRSFEDIKARGVMIVGIEDSFPPMAFRDAGRMNLPASISTSHGMRANVSD
jgi:ABC-type amino acid transport substrate-binding protein